MLLWQKFMHWEHVFRLIIFLNLFALSPQAILFLYCYVFNVSKFTDLSKASLCFFLLFQFVEVLIWHLTQTLLKYWLDTDFVEVLTWHLTQTLLMYWLDTDCVEVLTGHFTQTYPSFGSPWGYRNSIINQFTGVDRHS